MFFYCAFPFLPIIFLRPKLKYLPKLWVHLSPPLQELSGGSAELSFPQLSPTSVDREKMHDISHIDGVGGDTQASSMGPCCKPHLSGLDFLWSLRIEAEIGKCVISPEFG